MRDMRWQLDCVMELGTVDSLVGHRDLPFIAEFTAEPLLSKFMMPQMEAFDGAKDLMDHLETCKAYIGVELVDIGIIVFEKPSPTLDAAIIFEKPSPTSDSTEIPKSGEEEERTP